MILLQKIAAISGLCLLLVISVGCGEQTRIIKAKPAAETSTVISQPGPVELAEISDSLVEAGVVAFEKNDLTGATDILKKAYQADSLDWRPSYLLGRISAENKQYDQADKWLSVSLKTAPNDPQIRALIYELLGYNCEQQGQYGKAKLHYTTALQLNADSSMAQAGLERLQLISDANR